MTTSLQSRAFQVFNNNSINYNTKVRPPSIKKFNPITTINESSVFNSSNRTTKTGIVPLSPVGIIKPTIMTEKRRSSTISVGNLLPRRKSLQTTALQMRRQSLWMNIAKTVPANNDIGLLNDEPPSLMRKKILRLLLVFSYLLSISLLAIALATFYGFFWAGYSTAQTTNILDVKATVRSLVSLTSNSTFVDSDSEIE